MRLYAAKIEEFQYPAALVDADDAELLVGLGLVVIDPTHAWISERGVWLWEDWCAAQDWRWHRPPPRKRNIDVLSKSRLKAG
jgi:hypothetical protein